MKKIDCKKSIAAALGFALLGGLSGGVQAASAEEFMGSISYVGFNFAPRGYASCDGQLLPISSNTALFSLLGTYYGGDGRTTFALPDMRGRVPIHMGSGPGLTPHAIGSKGGNEKTTLSIANLASHGHTLSATSVSTSVLKGVTAAGDSITPSGKSHARSSTTGTKNFSSAAPSVDMAAGSVVTTTTTTGTAANAGGSQAFSNWQPYLTLNCVIAQEGIYPSRN